MKIKKRVNGYIIGINIVKLKDYNRFSLYQVYLITKNGYKPLFKECYTELEIKEIILKK